MGVAGSMSVVAIDADATVEPVSGGVSEAARALDAGVWSECLCAGCDG